VVNPALRKHRFSSARVTGGWTPVVDAWKIRGCR
jgi:hypothetical protein